MAAYPFDSRPFRHVSSNFLPFMSVQPVGGPMKSRILKLSILILLLTILSAAQDVASFEKRITVKQLDNGLTIEPGKTVKLAPGGYHLMLFDLKTPLKQGDKVPVTLEFEKAGKVMLSLDVQGVGAQGPAGVGNTGGHMDTKKMPGMKM